MLTEFLFWHYNPLKFRVRVRVRASHSNCCVYFRSYPSMKTAVLFLHGSGGTGPELQNYLNSFRIPQFNSKSFLTIASDNNYDIFTPSSKICNYTPVGGERMNVWYDRSANFISLGRKDKEHQSSVTDSIKEVI